MCQQEFVNSLNQFYVSVNADIPPLDSNILPAFLPAVAGVLTVQPHEVCKKPLAIKPSKAHGPDNVPCRIVKEFAYELAEPITTIFNTSLRSGTVPAVWKESNIIPIPKIQSPMDEGDFRPISLTPVPRLVYIPLNMSICARTFAHAYRACGSGREYCTYLYMRLDLR